MRIWQLRHAEIDTTAAICWAKMSSRGELTLAGIHPLGPRMAKFWVAGISAVPRPRTTPTATTKFAGFPDDAAFGAHGSI